MAYPNPPRTWSAAAVLTAAQLNAELRDALNTIIPTASGTLAWASYTPTLTQSATVTKTVTRARYFQIGKVVIANVNLAVTGTGTASNAIVAGLPVTAAVSAGVIGTGYCYDASANIVYGDSVVLASTTTVNFIVGGAGAGAFSVGNQTFTAGLANTDVVTYMVMYEAA